MPRLFVGNFDFEHELADGPGARGGAVDAVQASLAAAWLAVATPADWVLTASAFPRQLLDGRLPRCVGAFDEVPDGPDVELVPWGWTRRLQELGNRRGWKCPAPPMETVRLANNRLYRADLEAQLGIGLEGARQIRSEEELQSHIAQVAPGERWVLKAAFGMAGRERIPGCGPHLPEPTRNWCRRRLQKHGGIVFEPWLDRVEEAGLQLDVPASGEPLLLGITPLLTTPHGAYRGSRVEPVADTSPWQAAIAPALLIARELRSLGYFGPAGIDAMRYARPSGDIRLRCLQDLNARWTMGRLALGWNSQFRTGESGVWLQGRWSIEQVNSWSARRDACQIDDGIRVIPTAYGTNPEIVAAVLICAKTPITLASAEQEWLAGTGPA